MVELFDIFILYIEREIDLIFARLRYYLKYTI
jgi:hypothetical protein